MAQVGQGAAPTKKSKGGISQQTMITAGLGGVVLIEGAALALLWKKVNDIAARNDPNTNDNKHIAQYIALKDTEHAATIKDLTEKIKALETEQKKPAAATSDAALIKKVNQLSSDNNALLKHINQLTAAFNELETRVEELHQQLHQQPKNKNTHQQQRGRKQQIKRQEHSETEQDSSVDSRSASPPPRRATNIAPPRKAPTQQAPTTTAGTRKPQQKQQTATNTNKGRKTLNGAVSEKATARPTDEMPSEFDDE